VCLCACVLVCLCACVLVCLCACVLVCLCACVLAADARAQFRDEHGLRSDGHGSRGAEGAAISRRNDPTLTMCATVPCKE
jgi:hypothetical protein